MYIYEYYSSRTRLTSARTRYMIVHDDVHFDALGIVDVDAAVALDCCCPWLRRLVDRPSPPRPRALDVDDVALIAGDSADMALPGLYVRNSVSTTVSTQSFHEFKRRRTPIHTAR